MLFSVNEARKQLSIGRTLLYKLIADRELDTVRIGGRTLITKESVKRLIEARSTLKNAA